MLWPLATILAVFLTDGGSSVQNIPSPHQGKVRLIAAYWQEQSTYNAQAERDLLDLANRARKQGDLTPFRADEGLTRAARQHATVMAERGELSHQFSGEPELAQRLAENCSLYLVEAAENVASAQSADRAHDGLMHSVHHRENLLHPSYNVIGVGVVNRGGMLYIVQDFGNSLPTPSAHQAEDTMAKNVDANRKRANLAPLKRQEGSGAHKEACAMAQADSLKASTPQNFSAGRHILRYTSMEPNALPAAATAAIQDPSVNAYAIGTCFARSKTYPNGIYWVVLILY